MIYKTMLCSGLNALVVCAYHDGILTSWELEFKKCVKESKQCKEFLCCKRKDLEQGNSVDACIPNCKLQCSSYAGKNPGSMLQHFVLFRVASCNITSCLWLFGCL